MCVCVVGGVWSAQTSGGKSKFPLYCSSVLHGLSEVRNRAMKHEIQSQSGIDSGAVLLRVKFSVHALGMVW